MIDDRPDGPTLLQLARDVLTKDILPQMPEAQRLPLLLVAGAMAIAEREARSGNAGAEALRTGLTQLYGGGGDEPRLRRLAADIRSGAFDAGDARTQVRGLLREWTRAKLATCSPGWAEDR